jgi:hypothetical protein
MAPDAWASFCGRFPEDPDPAESRCAGVGEYLATKLREVGVTVTASDNWRDCGWSVDCRIDGRPIYFFVSYYGKRPVEYVLCCTSDRGLITWLRGINDVSHRWKLAKAVHGVLMGDDRFSEVRWYQEGWFAKGDEAWSSAPVDPDTAPSNGLKA